MKKTNSRAKSKSSPSSAATKHKEAAIKAQDTTAPAAEAAAVSTDQSPDVSATKPQADSSTADSTTADAKPAKSKDSAPSDKAAKTKSEASADEAAEAKDADKAAESQDAKSEDPESKAAADADEAAEADANKAKNAAEAEADKSAEAKAEADTSKAQTEHDQTDDKKQDLTVKDSAESKDQDKAPAGARALAPKIRKMTATKKKEAKSLATTEDTPIAEAFKARIIVVTSGKGGVGKTTTAAAISTGLALKGHKTAVIDFDVGLRNLDLIMGVELRVVYDFINVIHGEANLNQALIKDRHTDNLYILPASQTRDKDALTYQGVGKVMKELSDMGFEYIVCDSPAGIETGALIALYYADEAIVTTNPEVSSVRDSDRIIGILNARSRRAEQNLDPVIPKLLLTRYVPERVDKGEMLSNDDIQELLSIPLLGIIPESPDVLKASNAGETIILNQESEAGKAYEDAVERLLGKEVPFRFYQAKKKGFLAKLFGGD